ncbi:MAG: ribonucleotide reductase N-terminal alpha domain-containing protein, partial [Actinomycetota bacterium]
MANRAIKQICSRDGRLVPFDAGRIGRAIARAAEAAGRPNGKLADELCGRAVEQLKERFPGGEPGVEQIQDIVEDVLIAAGQPEVAKAYITYRQRHADIRAAKKFLGVADDLKLPLNALTVLKKRYLARDEKGEVTETPGQMLRRVARCVAAPDALYGGDPAATEEVFYSAMASREFLPNSPTLMNAETELGLLSAC